MTLVTRNPFALFSELQRDMNRMFDNRTLSNVDWEPAVDIHEDKDGFHLSVDLPGIKPDAIEVTAHNNVLSIRGTRSEVHDDKEQKRAERIFGSFLREFSMPDTADLEQIQAKTQDGVLAVFIPKTRKAEPKRITVQ